MRERWAIVFALVVASACGSSGGAAAPAADAAIETEVAPSGCRAGERLEADGHCEPAGVPPDRCAAGFESDGQRGCNAILPADRCPSGKAAIPGETSCHDVAPCGSGSWGDIVVEASTQFVDASYAGAAASNGSKSAPWKTIQDAINNSAPGAIVAVAAGSYAEDLRIEGKAVKLWGKCPAMVEIVGSASGIASVQIRTGADGTEIHALAIRAGALAGLALVGANHVVFDRLWVHDTGRRGIDIERAKDVTLGRSLVERAYEYGVFVSRSQVTIDAMVVRDSLPLPDKTFGRGINVTQYKGERASVLVRSSLIERNNEDGVAVFGSDTTIEGTLVRDNAPKAPDGNLGRGVFLSDDSGQRANVTLRGSVVERNHEAGFVAFGSDVTIEVTTIRDTQPRNSDHTRGGGLVVLSNPATAERSIGAITSTLIASSYETGLFVGNSDVTLDGVLIRDSKARASDGLFGDGMAIEAVNGGDIASVSVSASRIEASARGGVSSFGGSVKFGSTAFECNSFDLDGEKNSGIDFSFEDLGGNACGCSGTSVVCHVLSNGLAPPQAIGGP